MQFGFCPAEESDAIFIIRQMVFGEEKGSYDGFVNLGGRLSIECPGRLFWWALRVVGADEWIVKAIQAIMMELRVVSGIVEVRMGESKEFGVKVGIHQSSALESTSIYHCPGKHYLESLGAVQNRKLLYADDLDLMAE